MLDSVFDQYGNVYNLKDITVNDTIRQYGQDTLLPLVVSTYSSGYFKLYLDKNCGMENYATDTNHLARLKVICQMLTDVSQFINSPCNTTEQTINIWCRDISLMPNLPSACPGMITSFYNVPLIAGASGIADNTVWKTLNSGVDAYRNLGPPWNNGFNTGTTFFHAILAFNFNSPGSFTWNTSLTAPPAASPTVFDLYTESLHQMMHALGFASLISSTGASLLGSSHPYYSRYDMNLKTSSGTSLLSHTGSVSMYNYSFGVSASLLAPGGTCYADSTVCSTAIIYHGGLSYPQAVYTPNCFQPGISLSHFEDACRPTGSTEPMANNQYFLMSNVINAGDLPGSLKRYPRQEEQQVLVDIGYSVNNYFGDASNTNLNYFVYDTIYAPGGQVVGNNDGLSNGAYTFAFDSTGALTFTGSALIGNDSGTTGGSFEGLQLMSGSGTFSVTSGSASTSVSLTGASQGVSIFSYVPVSASGKRGNIAYGTLNKTTGACSTSLCNLIPNPGFESATGCGEIYEPYPYAATGFPSCWTSIMENPALYSAGCTTIGNGGFTYNVPDMNGTPSISAHTAPPGSPVNNNFMGLYGVKEQNAPISPSISLYETEGIQVTLAAPLIGGRTYYGTLWAKVANNSNVNTTTVRQTYPFVDLPGTIDIGLSNSTLATYYNALFFTIPGNVNIYRTYTNIAVPAPVPGPANAWTQFTFTITPPTGSSYSNFVVYNAVDQNYNVWGNIYPVDPYNVVRYSSYILVDDIRLTSYAIPTFTPPSPVHVCDAPLTNLAQYFSTSLSGGTFGGPGVTQTSNGTFTPSAITGALPQTVTIWYTYTDPNCGGTNTLYANITVTNSSVTLAATPNPVCSGNSVTLSATSCSSCTWAANGANFCTACSASQTVTPTSNTTYTVTQASGGNCSASTTVSLISTSINITTGPTTICMGTTPTTLTASLSDPSYFYTWQVRYSGGTWGTVASGTGTTSCIPNSITAGPAEYQVIVNTGSCTVTSAPVSVTFVPLPLVTLTGPYLTICDTPFASVTLTASPLGMTYNFDGNPISTTNPSITISTPTGPSIHTVKVTDANGCTATSSPVTVTLNVTPTVTASAVPNNICVGQTVSLSALASSGSYSWSPTTGANAVASGTSTSANTTATPTSSQLYTVTVTGSDGCATKAHVQVTAGSAPTLSISASLTNIYAGQSVILTATGGTTYSWSASPTSPLYALTSNQSSVSVIPASTTTYTVTSGPVGCSSTASVTINVITSSKSGTPCTGSTIFGGATPIPVSSGTLSSLSSNANYSMSGNIHLTGTMTVTNSNFWMASGATIYIDNNAFVEFSGCHFFTCLVNTDMWNGITFTSSAGSVYFTGGTLLEDANTGVYANNVTPSSHNTGGYVIKSDGATFNRCLKGLDIENYVSSSSPLTSYFTITNTVFTSRNLTQYNNSSVSFPKSYPFVWPPLSGTYGLKTAVTPTNNYTPPYNIVMPTAFQNTYAYAPTVVKSLSAALYGIYLYKAGYSSGCNMAGQTYVETAIGDGSTTTNKNIFDGMEAGIYKYNSNLSSVNNVFMNMSPGLYAPGDGIYTNDQGYCGRLRVWNGTGSIANEFYDCVNAVDAPNISELIGQNAKIISSVHNTYSIGASNVSGSFGYNARSWSFYNLNLNSNNITNVTNGIYAAAAMPSNIGFGIGSNNISNGPMSISNNIIQASAGSGVTNPCILHAITIQNLLNCPRCKITNNANVNGNQITGVYNGININGFNTQTIVCNSNSQLTIAQQSGAPNQYGIYVSACTSPTVRGNIISGPGYASSNTWGIYTTNNTKLTAWCNAVNNLGRGFEFAGNQPNTSWADNTMTNDGKGMVLTSGYMNTQVPLNSLLISMWEACDNQWLTTGGFSWSTTYPHTAVYNSYPWNSALYINSAGGAYSPTSNYSNPPQDKYSLTPPLPTLFPPGTAPRASLLVTSNLAPDCSGKLPPVPVYPISPFIQIAVAAMPYVQNTGINTWMDQMALWKLLQADSTMIDSSAQISEFATMAASSRYKNLTDIETSLANGYYTTAAAQISAMPEASPASDGTTGVVIADSTIDDYIVANYTSYYSLYIKCADSTMTSSDTAQLLGLANLCPLTNGAVVYQARGLYNAITGNPLLWADDSTCAVAFGMSEYRMAQGVQGEIAATAQAYRLYPNPNDGNINLVQTLVDNNPVHAEIWDGAGRKVYQNTLLFSNHAAKINISSVPGIYLIQLGDSAGKFYTLKFVMEK